MSAAHPYHNERCPTCGRFVPSEADGYHDLPPGGVQSVDYLVVYCDEACANRKNPPALYEGTPEHQAWDRARMAERAERLKAKRS